VMASGYSAEYTREIRAVSYSPVSDEIIPSNAKDTIVLTGYIKQLGNRLSD